MGLNINGLDELQGNLKQLAEKGVKELNKGLDKINSDLNGTEEKSKVPEKCPYCGATLPVDKEAATIKCDYCGAEFDNSAARTIADSVLDFVERQQQIGAEEKRRHLEELRLKAELKREKRKKSNRRRFFFIIIAIFAILYYYFVYMGGQIPQF